MEQKYNGMNLNIPEINPKAQQWGRQHNPIDEAMRQNNDDMAAYARKIKASETATTGGRKFDGGKLQYGLIPPLAQKAMVEILTFGAEKYEPDNWKHVPDSKRRYFDAAMRHLWDWKAGEQNDPESGKNHLAHAMCCISFLLERDLFTDEEWEERIKK